MDDVDVRLARTRERVAQQRRALDSAVQRSQSATDRATAAVFRAESRLSRTAQVLHAGELVAEFESLVAFEAAAVVAASEGVEILRVERMPDARIRVTYRRP